MKQIYQLIYNAEQSKAQFTTLSFDDDDRAEDVCKTLCKNGYKAEVINGWQVKIDLRK